MRRFCRPAIIIALLLVAVGAPARAAAQTDPHPSSRAAARQGRLVSGTVRDSSGGPVSGATVEIAGGFTRTFTTADGTFTLRLPAASVRLSVRRIGFRASVIDLPPAGGGDHANGDSLIITLVSAPEQIAGVLVPGAQTAPLALVATRQAITRAPSMVEPDALRALTFLPVVQQPNAFIGRLHVAGAALDEALLTIDGHPLQSAMHVRGIGAGITSLALDRTEVLAHHVPATLDTRAGGVIAMHSRRSSGEREGEAAISPLAVSVAHMEPALFGRAEVLASARVTYLDRMLHRVNPDYFGRDDNPINDYQDGLLRVSAPVGTWRVEALGLFSSETEHRAAPRAPLRAEYLAGVTVERREAERWTALRYSHNTATRSFGEFGQYPTRAALDARQRLSVLSAEVGRRLDPRSIASARIAVTDRDHAHRWDGRDDVRLTGRPNRFDGAQALTVLSAAARLERRWSPRWSGEFGVVAQHAGAGTFVAPRFLLGWSPSASLELGLSLERRHQFDGDYGGSLVIDHYTPLFLFARPRFVDGAAVSGEWRHTWSSRFGVALRGDVYARHIGDRPVGPVFPQSADSTILTSLAFDRKSGRAFGTGLGVTVTGPRGLAMQLAYGLSTVQERTDGVLHRSGWDRPHSLSVLATAPSFWGWSFSMGLRRQSGLPITPLLGIIPSPSPFQPDGMLSGRPLLGDPYAARLRAETRIDLALRHGWRMGRLRGDVNLQVFNAQNREPPLEVDWLVFESFATRPQVRATGISLVPTIGVSFRW